MTISECKAHRYYSTCLKAFLYIYCCTLKVWRISLITDRPMRNANRSRFIFICWLSVTLVSHCACTSVTSSIWIRLKDLKGKNTPGALAGIWDFRSCRHWQTDLYALFIFCTDFKWKSTAFLFYYFSHKGAMMLEAFRNVFAWPALVKRLPVSQELSL